MNEGNSPAALVGDREIAMTRVFDAPRALVFEVWTQPRHLAQWWGPNGFSTTTHRMEVRPGGVWRFVMHGPDGRDYQNKITYVEVVEGERLVYRHGGDKEVEPVKFEVAVTFADHGAGKTKVEMRMVFPSSVARDYVVKTYGAVEGLTQTMGRLGEHLAKGAPTGSGPFMISRTLDAPRELVWRAWTERERLMQWFGPKGFAIPVATLDFRPGGFFHYCMRSPDGKEMWGKFAYREIVPPERIVWVNSFADERGGVVRPPFEEDWPVEMLATATFVEEEGRTIVTIRWEPLNPTEAERRTFDASHDGMRMGWAGTFEKLAEYMAKG